MDAVIASHGGSCGAGLSCQGFDGNTLIRDRLLATDSKPSQALLVDTKGLPMNRSIWTAALIVPLSLVACDRPTVVTSPALVAVPGPAGPQGATGIQGNEGNTGNTCNTGATGTQGMEGTKGNKGDTGRSGDSTTVIVVPPAASAPTN